jgi:hypothetical protein
MKSFPLKLAAISISIICILSISAVSALLQEEASVTMSWLSPKYYQGDTASVRVTFQSHVSYELEINRVGIQFDWMPSDAFYSYDLSASPVTIPANGNYTFELANIRFLAGASAGVHSYFVSIDGLQSNSTFIWYSPSSTIQIYDGNEKQYDELLPQVTTKINNASYTSTEAQSLLEQATTEYAQALLSANEGKWQEAVSSLRDADDYLDQAAAADQRGGGQNPLQGWLLYLVIIIIVVVVALSVIAVVVRRRRKKTSEVPSVEEVQSDSEQNSEQTS